jgi:copper(I)-binding protein
VNRALRAAVIGVLLIAPVTLSACSAGQVNQTSAQNRDKVGATARVGDITLRGVELAFPRGGSYAKGSDAVLDAAIVNAGAQDDTLVSITGPGISGVAVTGTGSQATFATGGPAAAATGTAATGGAATSGAATTTTGAAATTGATPTTGAATTTAALPTEAPSSSAGIKIPGHTVVYFGLNAPHVTLTGLTRSLNAAQTLRLTFTFQRAGAVTIDAIVATPSSPVANSSTFDFEVPTQGDLPNNRAGGAQPPAAATGGNG